MGCCQNTPSHDSNQLNNLALDTVQPRIKDAIYVPPKRIKSKKIWSFPISIFKDWKKDDEVYLKIDFLYVNLFRKC